MTRKQQVLESVANELRKELVTKHHESKMAHIGSDLSCLDILIMLYFKIMNKDDRFVLSKGHAALALYSVLHKKKIITDSIYASLGKDGSLLGEHPFHGTRGVELATGSLGHGLSFAGGMAVAKKKSNEPGKIYVVLSDGECQEGSTLEAMNFIGRMKLNNLIAIVDNNKWQAYDRLLLSADQIKAEFKTAGWNVKEINGHDYKELETVFSSSSDSPILIMANTVLGKGIREMEDKLEWHYLSPTAEQADAFVLGIK